MDEGPWPDLLLWIHHCVGLRLKGEHCRCFPFQIHFTAIGYRFKDNLGYKILSMFSHIITYYSAFYESKLMTGLDYFRTFSSMILHLCGCGVMIFKSSFRLGCYTWVQRKRMRRDF